MKTYLPWRFDSEFVLNIHISIQYSNSYHQIALFVFVFVLNLRLNTIHIRIRFNFRKQILFVFVFVQKLLFVPTLIWILNEKELNILGTKYFGGGISPRETYRWSHICVSIKYSEAGKFLICNKLKSINSNFFSGIFFVSLNF